MVKSVPIDNKVSPQKFVQQSISELKKVHWPNKQQVVKLTGLVIGVSVFVGALIGGLDYLFTQLIGLIVK